MKLLKENIGRKQLDPIKDFLHLTQIAKATSKNNFNCFPFIDSISLFSVLDLGFLFLIQSLQFFPKLQIM